MKAKPKPSPPYERALRCGVPSAPIREWSSTELVAEFERRLQAIVPTRIFVGANLDVLLEEIGRRLVRP